MFDMAGYVEIKHLIDRVEAAGAALMATARHRDPMPFVEAIHAPALIVTGEHDPNPVSSRRALTGLVDGRLEVVAHTGHGSVLQRPDAIVELVEPFLAN